MRMEENRGFCGEEAMGEVKITKWRWRLGFGEVERKWKMKKMNIEW